MLFLGLPLMTIMSGLLSILALLLIEGATLIAMVFGLVDTGYPWAIPVALMGFAHEEPGISMLFVGMAMIWLARLLISPIAPALSLLRGVNPFVADSLAGQLTMFLAEKFGFELKLPATEDQRKVPYLRALMIKLVLIGGLFVFGAEVELLVGDFLPVWLKLLFDSALMAIAIMIGFLAEIPVLAGALYDPERKAKLIYTAEDTINFLLKWVATPVMVSMLAVGFVGNVTSTALHEVLGDQVYYDTFGHYGPVEQPDAKTARLEERSGRGYLRTQATKTVVAVLHPTKKGKRAKTTTTAPDPSSYSEKTQERLRRLEELEKI